MIVNVYEGGLYEAIEDLIAEGVLQREGDACGVARQVIANVGHYTFQTDILEPRRGKTAGLHNAGLSGGHRFA